MWKVLISYTAILPDGVEITKEARHQFDGICTYGEVLLALHELHGDDAVTKASIGYYDTPDKQT